VKKTLLSLLGAVAAVTAVAPPAHAADNDLKVMVRNVYLGADLIPLATTPADQFEQAAASRFRTVERNDFATRAKALAAEIRKYKPDVIGVQEAAVWRRSPDGVKDGNSTRASQVIYDSTEVLIKALAAAGQRYREIGGRDWFDFEAPTALGFDIRLTQRDVILGRVGSKVRFGKTFRGGYRDTFDPPTPIGPAPQNRGWVGVDAKLGRRNFRFITTHLEAYSPEIASKQMNQLLRGPAASKKRLTILVGDFNSDPKLGATDDRGANRGKNAYGATLDADFVNPLKRRETCCFGEDLTKTGERLDSWIDHVVTRPRVRAVRSALVGDRQVGGLYPSDHAGIAATLRLP
jgi:endonuclease/exonuclease/phosphatase family metal-dependent hydrolase